MKRTSRLRLFGLPQLLGVAALGLVATAGGASGAETLKIGVIAEAQAIAGASIPQAAQLGDALPDQLSSDAMTLIARQYRQRRQRDRRDRSGRRVDRHPAEHDVADDSAVHRGNQRQPHNALPPQGLDQIGFLGAAERRFVDQTDHRMVGGVFNANGHGDGSAHSTILIFV